MRRQSRLKSAIAKTAASPCNMALINTADGSAQFELPYRHCCHEPTLPRREENSIPSSMKRLALLTLFALNLAGCQSARYVYRDQASGVIAIPANTNKHRQVAAELMQQHFPGGYSIMDEGEYVTGQHTTVDENTFRPGDCDDSNFASTSTTATTRDTKEWRIRYRSNPIATASATAEIHPQR